MSILENGCFLSASTNHLNDPSSPEIPRSPAWYSVACRERHENMSLSFRVEGHHPGQGRVGTFFWTVVPRTSKIIAFWDIETIQFRGSNNLTDQGVLQMKLKNVPLQNGEQGWQSFGTESKVRTPWPIFKPANRRTGRYPTTQGIWMQMVYPANFKALHRVSKQNCHKLLYNHHFWSHILLLVVSQYFISPLNCHKMVEHPMIMC